MRGAGFTLTELVAVMIVVGILATYAIPRMVGRTGFESRGVYDQAQAIVRYAQKIAIAQRQSAPKTQIFVVINASTIQICYDAACITPLTDPSTGAALRLDVPGAVALTPATTFTFSGTGAPSIGARLAIQVSSSEAGDVSRTFYVEAQTGYVHP